MGGGGLKLGRRGWHGGDWRRAEWTMGLLKFVSKIIRTLYMPLEGPSDEP